MALTTVQAPPLFPTGHWSPYFYDRGYAGQVGYRDYTYSFDSISDAPSTYIVEMRYYKDGAIRTESITIPGSGSITITVGDNTGIPNAGQVSMRVKSTTLGQIVDVSSDSPLTPIWDPRDQKPSSNLTDKIGDAFQKAFDLITPIALDLNGDGIKYSPLATNGAYFDIDGDQFAEHVEWLDANDGFLVRDLNGNGKIDNIGEMFGGNGGTTAYAKLAALDTNANGKLDAGDSSFASLRIWQDANINGRVDAGELKTLAERNIASISTVGSSDTISGGHAVAGTSTFTYTNGTIGNAADVLLQTDQVDSWYVGTNSNPAIDLEALWLPQSRGYGVLPSLNYAMTQDASLKTLITNFTNMNTSTQMKEVYARMEAIVLKWAGVDAVSATGRGAFMDGRHLAALEKIMDKAYSQYHTFDATTRDPNPNDQAGLYLGYGYSQFINEVLTRLLVQGPMQSIFANAGYDYVTDKLILNDSLTTILSRAVTGAPTAGTADAKAYWNEIARVATTYSTQLGYTQASARMAVDAAAGFLTEVITVFGSDGNDYMGADSGGANGSAGSRDVFWGGIGSDTMRGGNASDIYIIGREAGNDVIGEYTHAFSEANDAIVFRDNIRAADVVLSRVNFWDLQIAIPSASKTVVIKDYFVTEYNRIEEIRFADGVVWGAATINGIANGTLSAPIIANGTTGNDTFTPTAAQAAIITGAGADRIVLNTASSAYLSIADFNYAQGDRIDITAFNGQITKLSDLNPVNVLGHAQITLPGGKVVVLSGVDAGRIDASWFISGTLTSTGISLVGTSAGDTLESFGGNDTLNGGLGADTLVGGIGNDTYNVDSSGDTVWEYLNEGTDIVLATASFTLPDHVENITISGAGTLNATGNALNNQITGNSSNNILSGLDGNDSIAAGSGNDTLLGGNGDDTLTGGVGSDYIDGGAGLDTVSYSASSVWVNVNLSTNNHWNGDAAWDNIVNVENVVGSNFNDVLTGNSLANTLSGGNGNDSLYGDVGDDYLDGGIGDDSLMGGAGNDQIVGGAGSDFIDGGDGFDMVSYRSSNTWVNIDLTLNNHWNGHASWDSIVNVEGIEGSNFNDQLTGNASSNTITAGTGNDLINGMAGNDRLVGAAGDDTLNGGDDSDVLIGGAGSDLINGGAGIDTLSYEGSTTWVSADLGLNNFWNGDASWDSVSNIENLKGSAYNDYLYGNATANNIDGSNGNDQITGNAGADTLVGGSGSELFIYKAISDSGIGAGNRDIIGDFSHAQGDKIDLSAFTGTFGFLGTGAFTGGTSPQVRYIDDGVNSIVQIDTNNDLNADFEIQVNGRVALVSSDFVL